MLATLEQAIGEIASVIVPFSKLVLLAGPEALEGKLHKNQAFASTDGNLPIAVVDSSGRSDKSARWIAENAMTQMTVEQQLMAGLDAWIGPEMAVRLRQQIIDGACLLLAMVSTPDEERAVAQVLLKYASGQIQVHDVPL